MKVRFDKIKDSGFMGKAVGTVVKTISKAGYPDGVYVVELEDGSKVQVPKKQATIVREMKSYKEFIKENVLSDIRRGWERFFDRIDQNGYKPGEFIKDLVRYYQEDSMTKELTKIDNGYKAVFTTSGDVKYEMDVLNNNGKYTVLINNKEMDLFNREAKGAYEFFDKEING